MRAKKQLLIAAAFFYTFLFSQTTNAQFILNSDSAFEAGVPSTGRIWGYAFGDYYYKAYADPSVRGGANQYTGVPEKRNALAFRRIYLGYDYNISKEFSAELLIAAEDNATLTDVTGNNTIGGDLLDDNKLAFYIKLANMRWKNSTT